MPARELHPELLIIRERDVGLFSMLLQILNTLSLLESQRIDRVPVVIMGRGISYFHEEGHEGRRTAWEYYFEPLVTHVSEEHVLAVLGGRALELLGSKRKHLEHARGAIEFPQNLHLLPPLTSRDKSNIAELEHIVGSRDWAWTESFNPIVDGMSQARSEAPPGSYPGLVERYIRPREHVLHKVRMLFDARLRGFHVIGVHVRGTDGFSAPARGIELPFDRYFREIDQRLAMVGRDSCRVFLATDEQYVVSRFEERFGDLLVYYDAVRNMDSENVFGAGPTGQVMPGYITNGSVSATQNGEDAVVEYSLLCKSDLLIHNLSSLSMVARLSVPASIRV